MRFSALIAVMASAMVLHGGPQAATTVAAAVTAISALNLIVTSPY